MHSLLSSAERDEDCCSSSCVKRFARATSVCLIRHTRQRAAGREGSGMSGNVENSATQVVVCSSCQTKNRVPAVAHGVPRCGKCHTPLLWVVNASDGDFADAVEASTVPVLVDMWAPWCGPCRMVSPVLEQLAGVRRASEAGRGQCRRGAGVEPAVPGLQQSRPSSSSNAAR